MLEQGANIRIEDPTAQRRIVKGIIGFKEYEGFYEDHFVDGRRSYWINTVRDRLTGTKVASPHFQLLAFVGMLGAQFGFGSMEGQLIRHKRRYWYRSPFSSRHQLAMAIYLGEVNAQAYPIKEELIERFPEGDNNRIIAWGINLPIIQGNVSVNIDEYLPTFEKDLANRSTSARPICLPDRRLHLALAQIPFDGELAEHMSDKEFETEVYPQIATILQQYFDPEIIFETETERRFPFRFFSYAQ